MFNKILFLRKFSDKFADKIQSKLKKKTKYLHVIATDIEKVKIKKSTKYDYIFVFRSHHILKKQLINQAKYAAINFHPGPPTYRGIGCVNYALFENSKTYGATAHLIDDKVDHGQIIDVKLFKISNLDNIEKVLKKTYKLQYYQAIRIINSLYKNNINLIKLLNNNKKVKWSKRIKNRLYLNKFYKISLNTDKSKLKKKLRATITKKFKPYVEIHGVKFFHK